MKTLHTLIVKVDAATFIFPNIRWSVLDLLVYAFSHRLEARYVEFEIIDL